MNCNQVGRGRTVIMKEIADYLVVHYSMVSRVVKRVEAGMHHCKKTCPHDLLHHLPHLEDDGEAFERDIAQAIMVQPPGGEGQERDRHLSVCASSNPGAGGDA